MDISIFLNSLGCIFDSVFCLKEEDHNMNFKVEVSYMEIYNEKVRDLLCPKR